MPKLFVSNNCAPVLAYCLNCPLNLKVELAVSWKLLTEEKAPVVILISNKNILTCVRFGGSEPSTSSSATIPRTLAVPTELPLWFVDVNKSIVV